MRACLSTRSDVSVSPTDTDVSRHGDMRASVRLAHDCDDANSACASDGLSGEPGQQSLLPLLRHGCDDVHQLRRAIESDARTDRILDLAHIDGVAAGASTIAADQLVHHLADALKQ